MMFGYKIEQGDDGQWYVVIVSMGNHEELMRSVDDAYTRHESAEHLVELLKKGGLDLVTIDEDQTKDMNGPDADVDDLDG
jgi:uncharacterized protein YegP (UPF0339 family)